MAQYELSFTDYWRILRKRYKVVLASVLVITGMAFFQLQTEKPMYRSYVKVKLEKPKMLAESFFEAVYAYSENPMVTESRVIESRLIAEQVARKIDSQAQSKDLKKFQKLTNIIQGSISAEPVSDTNIIKISVTALDPFQASLIANLVAESYIVFNLQEKNKQARKVREFVEAQLRHTQERLESAESEIARMREQGRATGLAVVLESRISDLRNQLINLLPKLTEVHPDVIRIKSQLAQMEEELQRLPESELEFARIKREMEVNEKTYRLLREKLEEARIAEAEKVGDASIIERASGAGRPIRAKKRIGMFVGAFLGLFLGFVLSFIIETFDTSIGTIEDVETLLKVPVLAVIPHIGIEEQYIKRPKKFQSLFRKSKTEEKSKRYQLALQAHYHSRSAAVEAHRILRTNVKFSPDRKTILVTSAGPAEGKTTLSCNLGIVAAQGGLRTLLLSCDLRRPELDRVFGISQEDGLSDVLRSGVPFESTLRGISDFVLGKFGYDEVINSPYLANLFMITPGKQLESPVELLGSKAMRDLLKKLKSEFDVVLIDSPPILPVADSLLLAPYVDGVILVYEVGRISRAALMRAKAQMDSVGANMIGVVLNHVRPEVQTQPRDYYYYRQRYAYRESDSSQKSKSSDNS